ncbi:MAG: hypothetical protein U1E81_15435 [Xanthobacteraceae bacterium]
MVRNIAIALVAGATLATGIALTPTEASAWGWRRPYYVGWGYRPYYAYGWGWRRHTMRITAVPAFSLTAGDRTAP